MLGLDILNTGKRDDIKQLHKTNHNLQLLKLTHSLHVQ
jgi:hypothetical protein